MNPLEIIGQETIWKHLASIFKRDKIGNAYLFHGSEGSGKEAIALKFSSLLNCLEANNIPCFKCASCMKYNSLQHP